LCWRRGWLADDVAVGVDRRREPADRTRAIAYAQLERLWRRTDVAVREKALWRLLYETAARASEVLSLDVGDVDLENRRAVVRSKGGDLELLHFQTGSARLPRMIAGRSSDSAASVPLQLVGGQWKRLVLANPQLAEGELDRRAYSFCVLEALQRAVDRRVGSSRAPDALPIQGPSCSAAQRGTPPGSRSARASTTAPTASTRLTASRRSWTAPTARPPRAWTPTSRWRSSASAGWTDTSTATHRRRIRLRYGSVSSPGFSTSSSATMRPRRGDALICVSGYLV
jgi:hypothetical protein